MNMMNEYESKSKELEDTIDALEIAHQRIDSLLEQNKQLDINIGELKQECQSLSGENIARWKSEGILRHMLHQTASALALDTVAQRTHRERNAILRQIIVRILQLLKSENLGMDDDIPF